MDKKPESSEPIPEKFTRDRIIKQLTENKIIRDAAQAKEDRKYALGSNNAKPTVRSSVPNPEPGSDDDPSNPPEA